RRAVRGDPGALGPQGRAGAVHGRAARRPGPDHRPGAVAGEPATAEVLRALLGLPRGGPPLRGAPSPGQDLLPALTGLRPAAAPGGPPARAPPGPPLRRAAHPGRA